MCCDFYCCKTTEREETDRNDLQKLNHVGKSASVPSTQQSLLSTNISSRGNSREVVIPAGSGRKAEEKIVKEEVQEPLMTLTSTDETWPPLVQALSGNAN